MVRRSWMLLLVLYAAPLHAQAEPTSAEIAVARRLFAEAVKAENANEWPLAADKLREAISIKETAGLRFHLAYCEEQMGRLVEAMVEYDRAGELAQAQPKAARDVLRQLEPKRRELREKIPTVTILLPDDIDEAELRLDGQTISSTVFGKPIPQNPGSVSIQIFSQGRTPFNREVSLAEGDKIVVTVELPPEVIPHEVSEEAVVTDSASEPALDSTSSLPSPLNLSLRSWVLLSEGIIATVALGVGVGFQFRASAADRRAESVRALLASDGLSPSGQCAIPQASSQGLCDDLGRAVADGTSHRNVSTIGFVGAGVSTAALLGTWLLWPSQTSSSGTAVRIVPVTGTAGNASVFVSGSF